MKTHYQGRMAGRAYCGAFVTSNLLTHNPSDVTCKLCLRHLGGLPRKPIEERKEGRRVTTATKTHWAHLDSDTPVCGEASRTATITRDQGAVTCGRCFRLLGIKPKYSTRALDSLLGRAFKETEGELAVALTEAEHALAESLKCKDPGEIIAELSGALRRLCDLLGSKTSN